MIEEIGTNAIEIIQTIARVVVAFAALIGGVSAWKGLSAWKKEKAAEHNREAALELIGAAWSLRGEMIHARREMHDLKSLCQKQLIIQGKFDVHGSAWQWLFKTTPVAELEAISNNLGLAISSFDEAVGKAKIMLRDLSEDRSMNILKHAVTMQDTIRHLRGIAELAMKTSNISYEENILNEEQITYVNLKTDELTSRVQQHKFLESFVELGEDLQLFIYPK